MKLMDSQRALLREISSGGNSGFVLDAVIARHMLEDDYVFENLKASFAHRDMTLDIGLVAIGLDVTLRSQCANSYHQVGLLVGVESKQSHAPRKGQRKRSGAEATSGFPFEVLDPANDDLAFEIFDPATSSLLDECSKEVGEEHWVSI